MEVKTGAGQEWQEGCGETKGESQTDTEVPNQVLPYASFYSGTQCFVTLSEIIIMFFTFIF